MDALGTETAFEVLARAQEMERAGHDVVHLEIGEPDFETATHIVDAAVEALRQGYTHYGPAAGLSELREGIALDLGGSRGVIVDPESVVVTPGAKPILFYSILALAQRGNEVIYPDPGFPIYESMIRFCGATPVPMCFRMENGRFVIDFDDLETKIGGRTRLVILNSPHNPTGASFDINQLQELARLLEKTDAIVLSDEVYSKIVYERNHLSICSIPGFLERTILLDGFSKSYAMTGWRLGYAALPKEFVPHVIKFIVNSVSCAPPFVQRAALKALTGSQNTVHQMTAEFKERRDVLVKGLRGIPGISCAMPEGAFYAFPDITEMGISSDEFAERVLKEVGVALLSGTAFGQHGDGFVRISYATSMSNIFKALERLEMFVHRLNA
jgi:aspartate aminotransferase